MTVIRTIDPHDEAALRAWYAVTRAGAVAGRRFPLVFGYDQEAVALRTPNAGAGRIDFAAYDDETLVGAAKLLLPLRENTGTAYWTLNVDPAHWRRGFGTALFEHGVRLAAERGRHKHLAEVDVPLDTGVAGHPGARFARKHGFASLHTEERMVLELPVPAERLAALREAAAEHHGDYDFVSWTDTCPAEHLDAYVDLRNAMERDVPTGQLNREPIRWDAERVRGSERRLALRGFTSLVTAARHRDGGLAGYSLMFVPAGTPEEVNQDDTLVMSGHRGHRLGTALKVRNLERLREQFGDRRRVHTWTDPDNAPMRAINHRFGFVSVEVMHEFARDDTA